MADVAQGEKAVLFAAVVHEGGLEAPLHLHHDPFVDVARDRLLHGHLDVEFDQFAVLHDRHPFLFQMDGIDQHLLFHNDPLK